MMEIVTLSPKEAAMLRELCECEDGKGLPLSGTEARTAGRLISKGLAWAIFNVYIANKAGRALVAEGRT